MITDSDQLWKDMKKYKQQRFLLGCQKSIKDEEGNNQEEEIGSSNILPNHAFGIDDIREVPVPGQQPL